MTTGSAGSAERLVLLAAAVVALWSTLPSGTAEARPTTRRVEPQPIRPAGAFGGAAEQRPRPGVARRYAAGLHQQPHHVLAVRLRLVMHDRVIVIQHVARHHAARAHIDQLKVNIGAVAVASADETVLRAASEIHH